MGRRLAAGLVSILGTVIWTHALAGLFRAAAGIPVEAVAPMAVWLTLAAVVTATVSVVASRRSGIVAAAGGAVGAAAIGLAHPAAFVPALALVASGAVFAVARAWLARRLPRALDTLCSARPRLTIVWVLLALLAVVQVGRLSTYMTNSDSDWFLLWPRAAIALTLVTLSVTGMAPFVAFAD